MSRSPHIVAGVLAIVAALPAVVAWYIIVFVQPPAIVAVWPALEQLQDLFSAENPFRWLFVWFAAFPVLCFAVGAAYLANLSATRSGALILLLACVALTVAALLFMDAMFAVLAALPMFWGVACVRRTRKLRSSSRAEAREAAGL